MGSWEAAQDNGVTDMASEPQGPGSPEELLEQQEWCVLTMATVNTCSGPRGHCCMAQREVTGSNCRVTWTRCCLSWLGQSLTLCTLTTQVQREGVRPDGPPQCLLAPVLMVPKGVSPLQSFIP